MKKQYLEALLSSLPDDTEIYIRVGDDAWPAKARFFNNDNVLYLEHTAGDHRNFPEGQRGINEVKILEPYNPDYEQDALCGVCKHPYYRYFDSFENNAPIGCKYCSCLIFQEN